MDAGETISLICSDIAKDLNLELVKSSLIAIEVTKDTLDIQGKASAEATIEFVWRKQHELQIANNISYPVTLGTDLLS